MNRKRIVLWLAAIMLLAFATAGFMLLTLGPSEVLPAIPNGANASEHRENEVDITKTEPLEGVEGLSLRSEEADIRVIPVDGDHITVRLYGNVQGNRMPDLALVCENGILKATVTRKPAFGIMLGGQGLTMDVSIPRQFHGETDIQTVSGNIGLDSFSGKRISLETVSGDIGLTGLSAAEVDLKTVSGDVSCAGFTAKETEIETTSGELLLNDIAGEIQLQTISGDIRIGSRTLEDSIKVNTTSGKVILEYPENAVFDLDYKTISGGFRSDFPLSQSNGGENKRIQGKAGKGGADISVESVSGSLEISYLAE